MAEMAAIPPDYDSDPGRWASRDPGWCVDGDIHDVVGGRIVADELRPVLDVGCGQGRLRELLPNGWPWIGIDSSPSQLRGVERVGSVVLGDASRLPFPSARFAAVAALWMLYHLEDPVGAIEEARRVLRPGGVFFACTSSRTSDPELIDSYPPTTFDAEEAPALVGSVFGRASTEVITWNAPLVQLRDRDAVARYLRSHDLPANALERVQPPLTLTKRGCLILGFKPT